MGMRRGGLFHGWCGGIEGKKDERREKRTKNTIH